MPQITASFHWQGVFDAVIFGGDFAYNLEDSNGSVGDEFMNGLTPVFSSHPVYTCAVSYPGARGVLFGSSSSSN